jgi:hypothetical protein
VRKTRKKNLDRRSKRKNKRGIEKQQEMLQERDIALIFFLKKLETLLWQVKL